MNRVPADSRKTLLIRPRILRRDLCLIRQYKVNSLKLVSEITQAAKGPRPLFKKPNTGLIN